MMKKLIKNIYEILNNYKEKLKEQRIIEINNRTNNGFSYYHTDIEQKLLNYEVSIYKNIEKKEILFKQILNIANKNPYALNGFETEIFRTYIGMYSNGKIQTITEISKRIKESEELIEQVIIEILEHLQKPYIQQILLEERDIKNKEKILKKDISYLVMTDNLEQIFRLVKINTIEDIINITDEQILAMNNQYGYDPEQILPPTRIIKQLNSMGLKIKNPELLKKIYKIYESDNIKYIEGTEIENHTIYVKTKLDMLEAQQFEPELLKTINLNERLITDKIINNGYMQKQFLNIIKQIGYEMINKRKNTSTINDIIKKEYYYLTQQELDIIERLIKNEFSIENKKTEDEEFIEEVYLKEKN